MTVSLAHTNTLILYTFANPPLPDRCHVESRTQVGFTEHDQQRYTDFPPGFLVFFLLACFRRSTSRIIQRGIIKRLLFIKQLRVDVHSTVLCDPFEGLRVWSFNARMGSSRPI